MDAGDGRADGREDRGGGDAGGTGGVGPKRKRKFSPIRWNPDGSSREPTSAFGAKLDRKGGEEQSVQKEEKGSSTAVLTEPGRLAQGPEVVVSGGEEAAPASGPKLGVGRGGTVDASRLKVRIKRELGLGTNKVQSAQSGPNTAVSDDGRTLDLPGAATRPDVSSSVPTASAATAGVVRGASDATSMGEAAELASPASPPPGSLPSGTGTAEAQSQPELDNSGIINEAEAGAPQPPQQPANDPQDPRGPDGSGLEDERRAGSRDSPHLKLQLLRQRLLQSRKRRASGEAEQEGARGEAEQEGARGRAPEQQRGERLGAEAGALEHRSNACSQEKRSDAVIMREAGSQGGPGPVPETGNERRAAERAESNVAIERDCGQPGDARDMAGIEAPDPVGEDEHERELGRTEPQGSLRDGQQQQQQQQQRQQAEEEEEEEGVYERELNQREREDLAQESRQQEGEEETEGDAMDVHAAEGGGVAEERSEGEEEGRGGSRWAMEVEEEEMVEEDERRLGILSARGGHAGYGKGRAQEAREERGERSTSESRSVSGSEEGEGEGGEGEGEGEGESVESAASRNPMLRACRSVDAFERLNRIAEGTYGVVYRARERATGEVVALKKVKMDLEKEGFPLTSLREINLLLSLSHPNVVSVREVVVGPNVDSIFLVMEYMEHDLRSALEAQRHAFTPSEAKCLMRQLLQGLRHLHANWVLHRDLKSSNLLLNNRGQLKICDFGMAREFGSPLKAYSHMVVTLWYRAPELLLGVSKYSTAVDMWSAGCVMAELLSREPLFPGKTEIEQLDKIFKTLGTPTEKLWPEFSQLPNAKRVNFVRQPYNRLREKFPEVAFGARPALSEAGLDLLKRLLAYDPSKRISAAEALAHDWFREVPLPKATELMPTFPAANEQDSRTRRRRAAQHSDDPQQQFVKDPAVRDDHGSMLGFFRQGKGPL